MRLKLSLTVSLFLYSIVLFAQDNTYNKVSIASPTAASLGKYGDIPVNNHTGIPSVSIPIYSVKEGPLNLSIDLSYHASGLKVMEQASWVGAGWSLNAGGVITRSVKGTPDEKHTGIVDNDYGHFSEYGYNSYFYGSYQETEGDFLSGNKDGEPDLFFFNFGGYSGKFYFNDDRTPVFLPQADFKLQYNYTGSGSIQSFVITTDDGTNYYFGKTTDATDTDPIETSYSYTSSNGVSAGSAISSWYLNKVQSHDSLFSISLHYDTDQSSFYTYSMATMNGTDNTTHEYDLVRNYVNGVRLKKISFSNGVVNFIAGAAREDLAGYAFPLTIVESTNTSSKSLAAISITDSSTSCKKFYFNYSYFTDASSLTGYFSASSIITDKKRLKLEKVQESLCDSSQLLPAYTFDYFSETVPRKLSLSQDHWGYSNGASNSRLIPTLTFDHLWVQQTGADRDSKWPEVRGGSLKKITYPTGGSTEMEFEPNKTWVSFPSFVPVYVDYKSVGYDGNQTTQYFNITFNETIHKIKIVNNATGGNGYVVTPAGSVSATPGQTIEHFVTFSPGTYSIGIQKASASTGHGVEVYFYDVDTVQVQMNDTVGGMRIKSIKHYDGVDTLHNMVTNYSYDLPNGHSSGYLYERPTYMQILKNDLYRDVFSGCFDNNNDACDPHPPGYYCSCSVGGQPHNNNFSITAYGTWTYFKSASSVRPMNSPQGNLIGYNKVKVSQPGNGYSLYYYYGSDIADIDSSNVCKKNINNFAYCDPVIPNFPEVPRQFEYKRGQLQKEEHYREGDVLLKSADYTYQYDQNPIETPSLIVATFPGTSNSISTRYTIINRFKSREIVVTKDYVPSSGYMETWNGSYFESPYHRKITRQRTVNSTGDTLETKFKYAFDFRITNCDTISTCHATYNGNAASCQGTLMSAFSTCTTMGCRNNAWRDFKLCISNYRKAYITCRRANYADASNNFNTCFQNAKSNANTDLKPILELQVKFINVPIEVSVWKNNYLVAATFNKYAYSLNPATAVYPSKLQKIPLSALSGSFTPSVVNGSGLTKDNRYEDESTVKFSSGNLAEVQKRDDMKVAYLWDYGKTYPIAEVTNADSAFIAYTSFEADGKGGWTFSGATSAHPSTPTGKRGYSLAGGNITRSGLSSGTTYVITYWKRDTSSTVTVNSGSGTLMATKNGWKLYRHEITGTTSFTINGTAYIDELRLHPKSAFMKTYTYCPLMGVTSECDANNRIVYYEYDNFNRLKLIRDDDGNILKRMDYKYQATYQQ